MSDGSRCTDCDAAVEPGDLFCPRCGVTVDQPATPTAHPDRRSVEPPEDADQRYDGFPWYVVGAALRALRAGDAASALRWIGSAGVTRLAFNLALGALAFLAIVWVARGRVETGAALWIGAAVAAALLLEPDPRTALVRGLNGTAVAAVAVRSVPQVIAALPERYTPDVGAVPPSPDPTVLLADGPTLLLVFGLAAAGQWLDRAIRDPD